MDDVAASFDETWARFRSLESLRLLPDTLEGQFGSGRTEYLAFLVTVEDAAARTYLNRAARGISGIPGVEPYPEPYWHVTIKSVGFRVPGPSLPDELSPAAAAAIQEAARSALATEPAFEVRLGRPNGFDNVVFVEVLDGGRLAAINARLLAAIPALIRQPYDSPNFLPHISIARFTSNEGLNPLKSVLSAVRDEATGGPALPVRRIDLIAARLSERAPAFELVASYALPAP